MCFFLFLQLRGKNLLVFLKFSTRTQNNMLVLFHPCSRRILFLINFLSKKLNFLIEKGKWAIKVINSTFRWNCYVSGMTSVISLLLFRTLFKDINNYLWTLSSIRNFRASLQKYNAVFFNFHECVIHYECEVLRYTSQAHTCWKSLVRDNIPRARTKLTKLRL